MDAIELKNAVANCAKRVRSQLTPGFEEKVYQNAMVIELKDSGLNVETDVPIKVYYKDHVVGDYRADLIVEKKMIVELKAVSAILPIHEVQLVNYLTATGIDSGMLINFGSDIIEIRYRTRIYKIKP